MIDVHADGRVLMIGLNRPKKKNAVNPEMFGLLADAYTRLCKDSELRCGVLYAAGDMFCSGLDLVAMAPLLMSQSNSETLNFVHDNQIDPFNWGSIGADNGERRTKPIVTAIQGACYTAGIELALSTDIVIVEEDALFYQSEVLRGIMPFGGAIERFTQRFGWGNAMRWLLTGDEFDAKEALRIGLAQEVVRNGCAVERARDLAGRIAAAAPRGVAAILQNAHAAVDEGSIAAARKLAGLLRDDIASSQDLKEGVAAVRERRTPAFTGN